MPAELEDPVWSLIRLRVGWSGSGRWRAIAEMRNESTADASGSFTLDVRSGSRSVATLTGTASPTEPGSTTSLELMSNEPFRAGSYRYRLSAGVGF